jgi:hypothetical protein
LAILPFPLLIFLLPPGLLSWQNPSAEKIFFFKKKESEVLGKSEEAEVVSEILTVTHDHNNPFRVEFDDPAWRAHLPSLKPLGRSETNLPDPLMWIRILTILLKIRRYFRKVHCSY